MTVTESLVGEPGNLLTMSVLMATGDFALWPLHSFIVQSIITLTDVKTQAMLLLTHSM